MVDPHARISGTAALVYGIGPSGESVRAAWTLRWASRMFFPRVC